MQKLLSFVVLHKVLKILFTFKLNKMHLIGFLDTIFNIRTFVPA